MTTRAQAETLLFTGLKRRNKTAKTLPVGNKTNRRRVNPMYCPVCASWVEVDLRPVRLHCTGCGLEATL